MVMKKSGITNLLSFLSYKKPKEVESFYIPEINEDSSQHEWEETLESQTRKSENVNVTKGVKKPIPASEMKKGKKEKKDNKDNEGKEELPVSIEDNIKFIKYRFNAKANKDIIVRELIVGGKYKAFIAYLDGMVDRITINNFILRPLLQNTGMDDVACQLDHILQSVIETNQAKKVIKREEIVHEILSGNTCLYVDGCDYYISSETKGYEKRGVDKPQVEGVVYGSQEAFNENLRTNITLIRKIIKNDKLTTEFIKIGDRNQNLCAIMYIDGLINPAIVKEVKRRIKGLKTDYIAGSGMLEQFIEDNPMSVIPSVLTTERPDRTSSHIVEGKAAIMAEGTPFAIIVPITLGSLFHSPEDSSLRWQYGTLLRFIRITAAFLASLLPGMYVALTNYHREMIPTDLLIAIAKARESVPFPTIVEVLIMEIAFELIREAGIRIPGIIGNTIGIIGALILGQAAVQANLVSPVLIIVVAVTGLGNFAIPNFSLAFAARISRMFFILMGAVLGFYGISLGVVAVAVLLCNMYSFGVPMLSFYAPKTRRSNDLFIRMPIWKQELRPDYVNALDKKRQTKVSRKWTKEDANVLKTGDKEGNDD